MRRKRRRRVRAAGRRTRMVVLARIFSAPWQGAIPLRVRIPPGNCRSSRQQSERTREATTSSEALR